MGRLLYFSDYTIMKTDTYQYNCHNSYKIRKFYNSSFESEEARFLIRIQDSQVYGRDFLLLNIP